MGARRGERLPEPFLPALPDLLLEVLSGSPLLTTSLWLAQWRSWDLKLRTLVSHLVLSLYFLVALLFLWRRNSSSLGLFLLTKSRAGPGCFDSELLLSVNQGVEVALQGEGACLEATIL